MEKRKNNSFLLLVLFWTSVIHTWFTIELLWALRIGGLIRSYWDMVIFFPQFALIYALPPKYPLDDKVIHVWRLIGKLLDALPASIAYGVIITLACTSAYKAISSFKKP